MSHLHLASPPLPEKFDPGIIRARFPALAQHVNGYPLVYLDNAATTQKPERVIRAMDTHLRRDVANVHRGVHALSERATAAYEASREAMRDFLHARSSRELVFVRGATEAINLVAATFGRQRVGRGDEILLSAMEHHANIVPWQLLAQQSGAVIRVIPMDDRGQLRLEELDDLLNRRTRLVALAHVSNALGTVNPLETIIEAAHSRGVPVLVDGAQAVAHEVLDVQRLDCDFYVFSGHKMYGPSGVGVLYGKLELLEEMPPYQGGGDMILSVSFQRSTYQEPPYRFEAGTPNIAGVVGLGAAVDFLSGLDRAAVATHEAQLLDYATRSLESIPGLRIIGTAPRKGPVLSFVLDDVHPHDLATLLDRQGVAVRSGHHCAQPTMECFGIPATTRASFGLYNTTSDVDRLVAALGNALEVFR